MHSMRRSQLERPHRLGGALVAYALRGVFPMWGHAKSQPPNSQDAFDSVLNRRGRRTMLSRPAPRIDCRR